MHWFAMISSGVPNRNRGSLLNFMEPAESISGREVMLAEPDRSPSSDEGLLGMLSLRPLVRLRLKSMMGSPGSRTNLAGAEGSEIRFL